MHLSVENNRQAPAAAFTEPPNTWQYGPPSQQRADLYRSPPTDKMDAPASGRGDADNPYARGGHGIFGEPMVS